MGPQRKDRHRGITHKSRLGGRYGSTKAKCTPRSVSTAARSQSKTSAWDRGSGGSRPEQRPGQAGGPRPGSLGLPGGHAMGALDDTQDPGH